jgi:hypothetical protein
MTQDRHADVALQFQDGTQIRAWKSFSWRDRYDDPVGSVRVKLTPTLEQLPVYLDLTERGNLIGVKMNGKAVHAPIITRRRFTSKQDGPVIELEAKSVLTTAYEGVASTILNLNVDSETPVADLILAALAPYGFDTIVSDTAGHVAAVTGASLSGRATEIIVDSLKKKDWQVTPKESAFRFCQRLLSRFGLALRVNFEGTLLLGRPDFDQDPTYALHQSTTAQPGSNRLVGGYAITETNDGQFSHIVVSSDAPDPKGHLRADAPFAAVHWDASAPDMAPFGEHIPLTALPAGLHSYRSQGAAYKPLFRHDKKAKTTERCANWATRLMGGRATQAWRMECEVEGIVSAEGAMWAVDTIAAVYLEDFALTEELWIHEVEKRADSDGGQRTRLTLIPKGSLVLTTDA